MGIKVGAPRLLGESREIFSVPVDVVSGSGQLLADGAVVVDVSADDDGSFDDAGLQGLAKQKALAMVKDDPGLLTAVKAGPGGNHHVTRDDGSPAPWNGDGFLDPPDGENHGVEPRRILSPDSPQTGQ